MVRSTIWSSLASLLLILAACGVPAAPSIPEGYAPLETAVATSLPTSSASASQTSVPTELVAPTSVDAASPVITSTAVLVASETALPVPSASPEPTISVTATVAATALPAQQATPEASATVAQSAPEGVVPLPSGGSGKLEIVDRWTYGGETEAFQAMLAIYKTLYPGVETIDTSIAGSAGSNARAELAARIQQGKIPDVFQVRAGPGLIDTWAKSGKLEPLTGLFEEQGWAKVMPKQLLDQVSYQGDIYAVPVDVHRSNMLWYNKQIFADNNLQPPATMADFFAVAEALKAKGITPLAVGGKDTFEAAHLFESVLLATFGADDYQRLFQAPYTLWADPRMADAIQTMKHMLDYANADRGTKTWADAAQDVLDGKAAMTIMGDWVEGYFVSKQAVPGQDFGWVPTPGTDGSFLWLSDTFAMPKQAANHDNALAWLKVAGSQNGQDAFNPKKGSIPARSDPARDFYDDYLRSSLDAFASNRLVPSVVHGAAANDEFVTVFDSALNAYSSGLDVTALNVALADAVQRLSR